MSAHDRGKIFTSKRARQVLVDRLHIITEQAPPYAPSANLFVEGSYVGETYCTQFMGGRVSEWEAKAIRKHDEMQASVAREQGREARARTQDEAAHAPKRRSAHIREVEQSRQLDRQREEIHPAEVFARLTSVESKKPSGLSLPPAVPDKDDDRPVRALRIRTLREEPLP